MGANKSVKAARVGVGVVLCEQDLPKNDDKYEEEEVVSTPADCVLLRQELQVLCSLKQEKDEAQGNDLYWLSVPKYPFNTADLVGMLYGEAESKLSKMVAKERPGRLSKRDINIALHGRINRQKWGGRFCDYGSAFVIELRERGILLRAAALVREFVWKTAQQDTSAPYRHHLSDVTWEVVLTRPVLEKSFITSAEHNFVRELFVQLLSLAKLRKISAVVIQSQRLDVCFWTSAPPNGRLSSGRHWVFCPEMCRASEAENPDFKPVASGLDADTRRHFRSTLEHFTIVHRPTSITDRYYYDEHGTPPYRFDTFERTHIWLFTRNKLREYAGAGHARLEAGGGNATMIRKFHAAEKKLKLRKMMDARRRQKEMEGRRREQKQLPLGYQHYHTKGMDSRITRPVPARRAKHTNDPNGEGGWTSRHYHRDRVYEIDGDDNIGASAAAETKNIVRRVVRDARRKKFSRK